MIKSDQPSEWVCTSRHKKCSLANKGSKETKSKIVLFANMIELYETNRMSHFPSFYDDFFLQKFNLKDWLFHSVVICGPELCKRDGIMKMRLATNINGYPLRLVLLPKSAYSDGADLILSC